MPFLGREFQQQADYSEEVARQIDDEIRRIIEEAHQAAKDLLGERRDLLDQISKILIQRETIEASEFLALLSGAPEAEAFSERDKKAALLAESLSPERQKAAHAAPPVPKPTKVHPETT
jgi:cell division protease FtsH